MSIDTIKNQLKTGELVSLYLLYGEEDYLREHYCRALSGKAVECMESFNLQSFDGENFMLHQFTSALFNLPVMSRRKCVILKDIQLEKLKADEWKDFQNLIKTIPEECVLILSFSSGRYDKKASRFKTILSNVQKNGICAEFEKQSKNSLVQWLCKRAEGQGCRLSQGLAAYLIEICGASMLRLDSELGKLCACANGNSIDKSMIDELSTRMLDSTVYMLAKSVSAGDMPHSIKLLEDLFEEKEDPVMILAALSGAFCDLYRAKAALISRVGQAEIEKAFNYKGREFRGRNAMRDCSGMDIHYLEDCLRLLMRADEALKSTRTDDRAILERLIVEIGTCRGRKTV